MDKRKIIAKVMEKLAKPSAKKIDTVEDMKEAIKSADPESKFKVGRKITVNNKMQSGYSYTLSEPIGKNFDPEFKPELSPKQMLDKGVFEGKYFNDCIYEYPKEWFETALKRNKLSPEQPNPKEINLFKIKSRQSLQEWRRKGWIIGKDPRGWAEWYFRYYLGRRDPEIDKKQIARWKSFARHKGQVEKNCKKKDLECRPKQRQALLQWAYNPQI